ncbi:hypothetical protein T230_13385 [Tannerella sp. oral taxon BU063 isolate Cell 1/3]|uniref:SH3b domain-containing protein n=1 Tax=Tannerella sp. oral taxon BU063 isolate Cell 1/3 TaxID=1411022 RepID=W2CG98_9BACT|nr:hypothetical protein T230_13385 [Tannerella sp. oral taxon BU063 isolate Cell 1/3]
MKTKHLFIALLLGLLIIASAAPAQDDDAPDYFRRPLRVQTAADKQPTVADFARAFASADQEKDPLFSTTLARIDGRQPKLPQGERFSCLIDRPHGYLRAVYTTEGNIDPNQTLEVCYWRTDTDHRLVAVCRCSDIGTYILIFYDYNPATGLMTPLAWPPFEDFHELLGELIVQLPREGKDIHMKSWWAGGPAPLTLRWNGRDGFTLVGAAERYRQPAPNQPTTCDFLALFKPEVTTGGEPVDLYDAPDGKVVRHLGIHDLDYDLRVKRAENGWAYVDYSNNLLGADSSEGSAWVRCTSLYVLPAGPVYTNYIYAEPTRASRRVATFDEAKDNSSDIWWKVLEIRKGWVKIRTTHLGITGWIESRILCGSIGVDC